MSRRNRILILVAVVGAIVVGVAGWYFFIRDDAPPPLTLEDAVTATTPLATAPTEPQAPPESTAPPASTVPPGTAAPTTTAPPPVTTFGPIPSGAWNIDQEGTVVGYRIAEELASIGGATAVGRTSEVTGTLVLDGAAITEVSVAVDMTSLASNDNRRDRQLRTRGLQTDQFPEATFMLDEPIDLGTVPAVGVPISATANGTLTLHGVSRSVTIVLDAQLLDATTIVVVGSTEVVLADYDIEPPVGFGVVSVADSGLFEFQLTFEA